MSYIILKPDKSDNNKPSYFYDKDESELIFVSSRELAETFATKDIAKDQMKCEGFENCFIIPA